jgi:exonuclease III
MSDHEILRPSQQDLNTVNKETDKSLYFTFPLDKNKNSFDFLGRKIMHFALKIQNLVKPADIHDLMGKLNIDKSKFTVKRVIKPMSNYIRISFEDLGDRSITENEFNMLKAKLKMQYNAILIKLKFRKTTLNNRESPKADPCINILTLNVNGLKAKKEEVWDKLNQFKPTIVFLQETEMKDMEKKTWIPGYKVFEIYNDLENKSRGLLVAILNNSDIIVNHIKNYDNIIVMGMKCKSGNFIIANIYNHCSGINRKNTLKDVSDILAKYSKDTSIGGVIIAGDWNAKPEEIRLKLNKHNINAYINSAPKEGTRVKSNRKVTERTIDFAIESREGLIIEQVVKHDWNISDHNPVDIKINIQSGYKPDLYKIIFDRTKLSEKAIASELKTHAYTLPDVDESAQTTVSRFIEEMTDKLQEKAVIRTQKVENRQYNLPKKIKNLIEIKRITDEKVRKGLAEVNDYHVAQKNVKEAIIAFRRKSTFKFKMRGIEALRSKNPRESWRWINQNCGNSRKTLENGLIKDQISGKIEHSVDGKRKIWKDHFENLAQPCECETMFDGQVKQNDMISSISDAPITWSEIACELKSTRKYKAAGDDLIPSEFYKLVENEESPNSNLAKMILIIINKVYSEGRVPEEWRNSTVVAIFKKGDTMDPNNYRGIALINTMLKILSKVLAKRLQNIVVDFGLVRREQIGFMKFEECVAQAASLLEICQRRQNEGRETILLFLDLKKAYDLVPHERLIQKLAAKGLGSKMLNMIRNMYQNTFMKVKVGDIITEAYMYRRGVRQGCPTSPMIFNLYIDDLLDEINPTKIPGITGEIRGLAFADDTIIFANDQKDLENKIEKVKKWMSSNSMELNPKKCGIMHIKNLIGPEPINQVTFYNEEVIPVVEKYTYLGVGFNRYLDYDIMVKHRCQIGIAASQKIASTLSDNSVPLIYKKMLVQNFLIPTLLYGQEIYGMSMERSTFAKKILDCSIMRIAKKNNFCRRRFYDELDIKDISICTALSRARGFFKWRHSKGPIKWLIDSQSRVKNRKRTWTQVTSTWLKKAGINSFDDKEKQLASLAKTLNDKAKLKDKSLIGETATKYKIRSGKVVRKVQIENSLNNNGINGLLKIRTGNLLYSGEILRKASAKLDPNKIALLKNKCLCCKQDVKEDEVHLLLSCPAFIQERKFHFDDLMQNFANNSPNKIISEKNKMNILLGGESPAYKCKPIENIVYTIKYLTDILPKRAAMIAELLGAV